MRATQTLRLGILGSGAGTNFDAIARARDDGRLPAEIAIALSDVPDCGIIQLARQRGIPTRHIAPGDYRTKLDEAAEADFIEALREAKVDLVVLAGFMRILKGEFLRAFPDRVINIHPSLLPSFPGLAAWKQALDYGVHITGCTVHLVDQGVDTGRILGQQAVSIQPGDTPDTLRARIQESEHELYPLVLRRIAMGEILLDQGSPGSAQPLRRN